MNETNRVRTVSVLQPFFIPWLGVFNLMDRSDVFVILDNVQFVRQSWQQRNRIKTSQGVSWLTVPVKHRFGQMILDTEIDNSGIWIKKHLSTIKMNYDRAPFFDGIFPLVRKSYEQINGKLVDFNVSLLISIAAYLSIRPRVIFSHDLPVKKSKGKNYVIEICRFLGAQRYLNGPLGRKLYDVAEFKRNGLDLVFQDFVHPVYPQLYGDFVSHLSVIDILFNCGRNSRDYILGGYK